MRRLGVKQYGDIRPSEIGCRPENLADVVESIQISQLPPGPADHVVRRIKSMNAEGGIALGGRTGGVCAKKVALDRVAAAVPCPPTAAVDDRLPDCDCVGGSAALWLRPRNTAVPAAPPPTRTTVGTSPRAFAVSTGIFSFGGIPKPSFSNGTSEIKNTDVPPASSLP